jgi:hypothetical protein
MKGIKAVRCEVYSRIVGYYRPVQDWHSSKKQEFKERYVRSNMDIERLLRREEEGNEQDRVW